MNAYCPECETELDQATGICPACRWDPTAIARAVQPERKEPEMSLTERYRGTQYDITLGQAVHESGVARGRTFVVISLVAGAGLYAVILSTMGIF